MYAIVLSSDALQKANNLLFLVLKGRGCSGHNGKCMPLNVFIRSAVHLTGHTVFFSLQLISAQINASYMTC